MNHIKALGAGGSSGSRGPALRHGTGATGAGLRLRLALGEGVRTSEEGEL